MKKVEGKKSLSSYHPQITIINILLYSLPNLTKNIFFNRVDTFLHFHALRCISYRCHCLVEDKIKGFWGPTTQCLYYESIKLSIDLGSV